MSVGYILSQAGVKMGLNPQDPNQRPVLLRFLNEAADELYAQADVSGTLMERVFKINGDQTVAMPTDVGPIRAIREFNSQIPWHINQMRPRYNVANWPDMWRNYRLVGRRALMRAVTNQAQVVITVQSVENPPIVITVGGSRDGAAHIVESVIMDAVSKSTVNNFNDIDSATRDRVSNEDAVLSDIDGNLLTVVPNNEMFASYEIIDVSALPWLNISESQQDHYVEVLYKKKLPTFLNDGDEYPAQGYDNILVNKILQLWAEEESKPQEALMYDSKASRSMARKHEEENRATEDTVAFIPNPHDSLQVRIRPNKPGRYRGYTYPYGLR